MFKNGCLKKDVLLFGAYNRVGFMTKLIAPAEDNDSIINMFSAEKISGFCLGGASYTLIDKEGNLTNSLESPILLTEEKIYQYIVFLTVK